MPKHPIIKFDPTVPAKFAEWFGPPALLSAEDRQIHDTILCGFFQNVRPRDFIECMLTYDLAYNVCQRLALRRRRDKIIRHANNEKFEQRKRELLQDAERRKEEIRRLNKMFEPRSHGACDAKTEMKIAIEREIQETKMNKQLAEIDAETNQKSAELQKAKDDPFDEAATFDQWIDAVERIDDELAMVEQNIRINLKGLDEHRTGLGPRLRRATDEIIDGVFTEQQAPARERALASAESASSAEVGEASTGVTAASRVLELPSPTSSQSDGVAPVRLDGRAGSALAPGGGPTEQHN
jgi:hypothetical protein